MTRRRRIAVLAIIAAAIVLPPYVGSYIGLSRPAIAQARGYNSEYYYFVSPRTDAGFREHRRWRLLYYPLWWIESIFNGFAPARSQPMYDISFDGERREDRAAVTPAGVMLSMMVASATGDVAGAQSPANGCDPFRDRYSTCMSGACSMMTPVVSRFDSV